MKKILVPFDGSENAIRALRFAMQLCRECGQPAVHLVYAHTEPLLYGEVAVYVPKAKMEELQRQHGDGVLGVGEEILREAGVTYTREILIGPIAAAIVNRAEELGCDAIVMGTRGMTPIGGLVMGSVAMKVIHLASVPVTLVK